MSIFDSIFKSVSNESDEEKKGARNSGNRTESFSFSAIPANVAELKALPEASLDSPFKTVALTLVALCCYENDPEAAFDMLNFLKGPVDLSPFEKQFIKERLYEKEYKARSFFKGASPENSYSPTVPYTLSVSESPYSYPDENWATLYVTSGGADNPRSVKLRKKPSTGQWFLNEIQCLSDIREPADKDPWA